VQALVAAPKGFGVGVGVGVEVGIGVEPESGKVLAAWESLEAIEFWPAQF